jgi:hypothetical protein
MTPCWPIELKFIVTHPLVETGDAVQGDVH